MIKFNEYFENLFLESMNNYEDILRKLKNKYSGSKVFRVGGAVRDELYSQFHLDKKLLNKDIDYLITGISIKDISNFLSSYGDIDMVGASFGVLKFRPENMSKNEEPLDIAIPRTEKKKKDGQKHVDFDIYSDPFLKPEEDLKRRDFTINAIAKEIDGDIFDPYSGIKDLKSKILRATDINVFADDPLRLLRGIQFMARFDMELDNKTLKLFKQYSDELKNISPERIREEFNKLFTKGKNIIKAINVANECKFIKNTIGIENFDMNKVEKLNNVDPKNRKLYISITYLLKDMSWDEIKNVLQNKLRCSNVEIDKAELFYSAFGINSDKDARKWMTVFGKNKNPLEISKEFINIFDLLGFSKISQYIEDNLKYEYLFTVPRSLSVSGEDLMNIGYKGIEIRNAFNKIIDFLIDNPDQNNKKILLQKV